MPIGYDFQRRYATIVLDLEQLNKDLNKVLHEVQQYCYKVITHCLLHIHTFLNIHIQCTPVPAYHCVNVPD